MACLTNRSLRNCPGEKCRQTLSSYQIASRMGQVELDSTGGVQQSHRSVVVLEIRPTEAKGLRRPSLRGRASSLLPLPILGASHMAACPTSTPAASSFLRLPRRSTSFTALRRLNYRWRSPLRPWMKEMGAVQGLIRHVKPWAQLAP